MLCYYPLEHIYWLLTHSIIPQTFSLPTVISKLRSSAKGPSDTVTLDAGLISRLSTRFWAAYIFLQFLHLREDRRLLKMHEREMNKSKVC